jgi:hypothetical protein
MQGRHIWTAERATTDGSNHSLATISFIVNRQKSVGLERNKRAVMSGTARPRKRSRTSEDADDLAVISKGKKARGRPRVDTQDATAADVSIT